MCPAVNLMIWEVEKTRERERDDGDEQSTHVTSTMGNYGLCSRMIWGWGESLHQTSRSKSAVTTSRFLSSKRSRNGQEVKRKSQTRSIGAHAQAQGRQRRRETSPSWMLGGSHSRVLYRAEWGSAWCYLVMVLGPAQSMSGCWRMLHRLKNGVVAHYPHLKMVVWRSTQICVHMWVWGRPPWRSLWLESCLSWLPKVAGLGG